MEDCGYYGPLPDLPAIGSRLFLSLEQPPTSFPDGIIMRSCQGPRIRFVIEGEAKFVDAIMAAAADAIAEARAEIEAAKR